MNLKTLDSRITGRNSVDNPMVNRQLIPYGVSVENIMVEKLENTRSVITVALVEDHCMVREGTRDLLEKSPGIEVIGEAGTGDQAIHLLDYLVPDVMIVDIQLPDMSGIEVVRASINKSPRIKCVILSAYDDYVFAAEALDAGAHGYLLKTIGIAELIGAVHAVAAGSTVLDEAISRRLTKHWHHYDRPPAEELTRREVDVMKMLAQGNSNKEIAHELNLGIRTVESYVSNILSKFGVRSRTEAVVYALNNHIISPDNIELSK